MFVSKNPNQVNFLKIEDLNDDLELAMKNLCKWLGLNFSDILLNETVNLISYNTSATKMTQRKMSTKIRNTRWVHSLTSTEVVLIEFLHKELIKDHYAFTSNQLLRNRFMAMLLLFMPNWKPTDSDSDSTFSLSEYFFHNKGLIARLNWLKLIRAVGRKESIGERIDW